MPPEGRDLILAGALLSITLNPLVFAALDRLSLGLRGHPGILARQERRGGDSLASLAVVAADGPRDPVIIVAELTRRVEKLATIFVALQQIGTRHCRGVKRAGGRFRRGLERIRRWTRVR